MRRCGILVMAIVLAVGGWSGHRATVIAQGESGTVRHRVNTGGPAVTATPNWLADTKAAASPFVNAAAAGNATFATSTGIDLTHPSLPAGIPASLFQSERYDPAGGAEMQWSFPVTPGSYEVRLYFAEIWFTTPGSRIFDVSVEGSLVLNDYDIVADVGAFTGVMKAFTISADSTLNIAFGRVLENPKVNAIEIIDLTPSAGEIGVSPTSLAFGTVLVGQTGMQTVQVTNLGGSGDPSIGVHATTIVGADASQFSDNFNDGATVTLAPGQSTSITVTFAPTLTGPTSAVLEIAHSGSNSPVSVPLGGTGTTAPVGTWQTLASSGVARHEISYVHYDGKFYLTGDRGFLLHEVYDAETNSWSAGPPLPTEAHHAQAVQLNGLIYYLGGLVGPYPDHVTPVVRIFNPATNTWSTGTSMPALRARGGGGTALHSGKLYVAGGLRDDATGTGHEGASSNLFDVYDPAAGPGGTWTALPNMPRARDHFHAAVIGNKLYAIAGREGGGPGFFNAVIAPVDVYDFTTGTWSTLPASANIPTPRAGTAAAVIGFEIVVIGGEGNGNVYNKVEAFNTATGSWRTLAPMPTARHGIQAAVCNGGIYIVDGGLSQGGSSFTNKHEVFFLGTPAPCGDAPPPSSAYRVNAGGPAIAGTPGWSADTSGSPSPYVNAAAAGAGTFSTSSSVNTAHPSVPAGTPASMFQTERFDGAAGLEMQWSFPVTPGTYEVRLYFAEIWYTTPGSRVFDVTVEGTLALDNYDIVADVGPMAGVMKSFIVSADDTLNIDFGHVTENPKVSGIEILSSSQAEVLGASPTSVSFGSVLVGQSGARQLQLANLGGPGAPNILIDSTNITGTHASQFADNFNDAGSVNLAPGQSTTITVNFLPSSSGDKSASLQIVHTGNNSPLTVPLNGTATTGGTVGFGKSALAGATNLSSPTSLQFGPDGRLYVGQHNGVIRIYTVARNGPNSYAVASTQTITTINSMPNRNDDGQLNSSVTSRLITGLLVVGTAANPVIYVAHSDPRIGGGNSGADLNLDTNSSMISRLTWTGSAWQKLDLVRGLPRSEENHAANGMQLDPVNNILYVAMGGNTNKGATSNNFALLPEFALSAAILTVNLTAIGNSTYDLPTLDDESRPGNPDANDPFGGNNGKNQARLVPGGPVQVYAPGFRNPYDIVMTQSGRLYTIDNGGNAGWGDVPIGEGPGGGCTNGVKEPGTTSPDSLHLITGPGYYGGHPNPTRANMANTFNATNPQSPVSVANPVECDYREAGPQSGALATFVASTNGLAEYTAGNFGGAMQGNLLAASWNGKVYRVQLDATGTVATNVSPLFSSVGNLPLDVVALGPSSPLPGTIWVGLYGANQIVVFEPNDFDNGGPECTGADNPALDEDSDGFDNADEIDNGTNPCSAGDTPPDNDGDFTSDLNDPDDDNDGTPDLVDPFPLDQTNGTSKVLPVEYWWENDGSNPGGILNLGFTGLMANGVANYLALYDPTKMTAGGAAGVVTVDQVSEGDAFGGFNTQQYGLQFGVSANPATTDAFFVHTRILAPFSGLVPQSGQSMGLFIGTGDQENYAKIVVSAGSGGGVAFLKETGGVASPEVSLPVALPGPNYIDLYLRVDPDRATVQPFYSVTSGGVTGPQVMLSLPQSVPAAWFTNPSFGLAVGIISTSRGPAPEFPATWDFIRAVPATAAPALGVSPTSLNFGSVTVGATQSLNLQLGSVGNAESATLFLGSPTLTGTNPSQFSHGFGAPGTPLSPGETATRTVNFTPTTAGSKTATLGVVHSGSNSPVPLLLSGSGVAGTTPALGVSPTTLPFGDVLLGQTRNLAVQLTNLGSSDLIVDATSITGTHAAQFSDDFNDATNVTLGPGATATVTVTFGPTSTGSKSATLAIVHSGSNSPVQVPLTGNGTTAPALPRVNAGGPQVSGTPNWTADTSKSPSVFVNAEAAATSTFSVSSAIDMSHPSLPSGLPASLLQSERYDTTGGGNMQWSFPVTPGSYEVRLYFAEIWFTTPGSRVFDVSIEGTLVLDNYDIAADVGPRAGVMKTFTITADSSLDILFGRVVENPKISAIEIRAAGGNPGQIGVSPTALDFGTVTVGQSAQRTLVLTNLGGAGDPGIDVYATTITGTSAAQFSDNFTDTVAVTLAPGASTSITVTFQPTTTGPKTASLQVDHFGMASPAVVSLTATGTEVPPGGGGQTYRVNTGGGTVSGATVWAADTKGSPSQYVNAAAAGNQTYSTSSSINLSHPSLPASLPAAILKSERYDPAAGTTMQWSFPVTPGTYEVRLYFAEIWFTTAGSRVFDVSIEGATVLNDYDIVADVGAFTGVMKSFAVTSDATLSILLGRVIENPKISAIEIVPITP